MTEIQTRLLLTLLVCAATIGCGGAESGLDQPQAAPWSTARAELVGREACSECHGAQVSEWSGSHHDLAMQPATDDTVLGNFDDTSFIYAGITSRFTRGPGGFVVETDGPDGELRRYEVVYTFGVDPLQQYLVELDRGRLQVLPFCWDTRPADAGGQRWFHLYPDEQIAHDDVLHWTSSTFTWNFMCADCHSTGLDKGYDTASNTYDTVFREIDVSCEACHGPASNHLVWAKASDRDTADSDRTRGFDQVLTDSDGGEWAFASSGGGPARPNAARTVPRNEHREIDTCAPCHSRRATVHADWRPGDHFLDAYRPELVRVPLYWPDGQIRDEVYVYGSFKQSKMYQQGVTCKDCHDPHSLRLEGTTQTVCLQCHSSEVYDSSEHHHHQRLSAGALCVECHMPETTYMVVDPRRDHGFKVPRPDLSVELGTPNACTGCHEDQDAVWAAEEVASWYPNGRSTRGPGLAHALAAANNTSLDADLLLAEVARDTEQSAFVRASALAELARFPGPSALAAVEPGLVDPDPLTRMGALRALGSMDPMTRLQLGSALLDDEVKVVRVEAARQLSGLASSDQARSLGGNLSARLDLAFSELEASLLVDADRPEAHVSIGSLQLERGDLSGARGSFQRALELQPGLPVAAINLADVERLEGNSTASVTVIEAALQHFPEDPGLQHALGLALIRSGERHAALASLERAAKLAPGEPRYAYVFAVALHDLGQPTKALDTLEQTLERHPGHRETLEALVSYSRSAGDRESALRYARRLQAVTPSNPALDRLIRELEPWTNHHETTSDSHMRSPVPFRYDTFVASVTLIAIAIFAPAAAQVPENWTQPT